MDEPTEKICSKCHTLKPLDQYHKQAKGRYGKMANCKTCHNLAVKKWQEANPDKWRAAKGKAQAAYLIRLRTKAIDFLGGACCRCGITDKRILEIDHIDGGGTIESRAIGNHGIHNRILRGAPGYQVLCCNCHAIKTWHE